MCEPLSPIVSYEIYTFDHVPSPQCVIRVDLTFNNPWRYIMATLKGRILLGEDSLFPRSAEEMLRRTPFQSWSPT